MQRVVRFNSLADHFADLADDSAGDLRETYRSIESAYRLMAMSVRIELWWPMSGSPRAGRGPSDRAAA